MYEFRPPPLRSGGGLTRFNDILGAGVVLITRRRQGAE